MSRGELPRVQTVYVKELAAETGLCEDTILRRIKRWEQNPADPLGIPYLRRLGRPYQIPVSVVRLILSAEGVT